MATGLNSGTYKVCIIDALGCFVCDSSIFIDNKICSDFYIYASGSETACNICDDGTAWVNIDGGKPPYYYSWFTSPIQTKDTAKGLPVGKYKVCVKDSIGCIVCDSVSIYSRDCSAYFELYPTSTPYIYNAVNMASGMGPLKYEWSWGDGSFDTIALPTHNYNKAGFYKICLKITDSVGCINTYCNSFYLLKSDNPMITVNVIPPAITGIQENISNNSFNVYPNPCKDFIYISSKNKLAHSYDVIIKNLQGQEIFYQQGLLSNKYLLNLNYLKNGIYFLNINNYSGNNVYKIIIQN